MDCIALFAHVHLGTILSLRACSHLIITCYTCQSFITICDCQTKLSHRQAHACSCDQDMKTKVSMLKLATSPQYQSWHYIIMMTDWSMPEREVTMLHAAMV